MRNILLIVFCIVGISVLAKDAELKVGEKAKSCDLKDVNGGTKSLRAWEGKVLMISYVDPDDTTASEKLSEALAEAIRKGIISPDKCFGMGVIDFQSSWKPSSLIRLVAKRKAKKVAKQNTVILFDYDSILRKKWGLKDDDSKLVVLDKNHVCQAIYKGNLPREKVDSIIKLVSNLQNK